MKISLDRYSIPSNDLTRLIRWGAALFLAIAAPAWAAERQLLQGHVPAAVAHLTPLDRMSGSQRLNLAIGLPLRNKETLTNLLGELYNPASPQYHQYLIPQQFTARFGPSEEDYKALIAWASAQGLEVTATHPNRAVLSVRAEVAEIEKALHVTMRLYQHPAEARKFYSPDAEPSLDLTVPVLSIGGLSDYSLPHPMMVQKAQDLTANAQPNLGSGPGGSYMGDDFRAAYIPGSPLNGGGQSVGLLQFDAFFPNDITTYESLTGRPNVPITVVPIDGGTTPGFGSSEVALDIEMVISMAPGVSNIFVYEAPNPSPWVDILSRMANDNLSKQLSCSWGGGPPDPAGDQIFLQMAAQGQSFFNASGDSDAFNAPISFPSESPYIMEVGGTTLSTAGPGGAWQSEKVWNWGGGIGTCGGISTTYSIPTWQQGIDMSTNQGSTTMRNIPDVALTADNVFVVYDNGSQGIFGGTSCAAPLWGAFTALINQQAAIGAQPPVGFLNPALYAIGKGPNYANCFHDTTVGDNTWAGSPNLFFAVPGYDLCTGWGTPVGTNLIYLLTSPIARPSLIVVSNFVFGGNGNGIIDFDECNSLNLVLANVGNANATHVSATLSTTTPGVAVAQATSLYPNIPSGGTATNLTPFKISTGQSFVCGTPINFELLLQSDQAISVVQFTLPTGLPGLPLRFDNNSLVMVPTPGSTNSSVTVSNVSFAVNKVTVSMFIQAFYDYFLELELVSPDGTTNVLSVNNGLYGQNYGVACSPDPQRTTFDDAAPTPVGSGGAPFVGAFSPTQPLSVFVGKSGTNVNGVWQLRVTDQLGVSAAMIDCWSLFITPTLCSDGGGECPGADMALGMTAQPNPILAGNNLTYTIAITNNGPSTASNVTATCLLPAGVLFVSASSSQGSYAHSDGVISFSVGVMAPRATATLTVVALPTAAGKIFTTASVSSEQVDFNALNNSAIVATLVNPPTADLAVAIAAAPSPSLVGNPLTYTVSLTNNGPSSASGISVTNVLPAGASIVSINGTQGSFTTVGQVVFWSLSGLLSGQGATATIVVRPTIEGTVTATTAVAGGQFDPISGNNTATVSTVVGPAADLAVGITDFPDPVVAGSNVTYTVSVTNFGSSTATGVIVNDALPTSVSVLSANATQGAVAVSNSTLIWTVGTLSNSTKATMTIVVGTTTNGTLSSTVTILAAQPDPNLANNSASASTVVAAPFVSIVAAGATLTAESFTPPNGAIDVGETVTVILRLRNAGNVPTRNLIATLATSDGVVPVPPNNSQSCGVLAPSGFPVGRSFSFTATGTNGQTISPTLQLHDGTTTYPPVSFSFTLPNAFVFANTNSITIPDPAAPNPPYPPQSGPAKPYPSIIAVSNLTGVLGKVTVTLSNLSHTYSGDVNLLLVGPGGAKTLLMSHAGDQSVSGLNLSFDDSAAGPLPSAGGLISGTWRPSVYSPALQLGGFPTNAPAGPYPAGLYVFNSSNPNGTWSLYVFDDGQGDDGNILGGWSLAFTMITPVNQLADLGLSAAATPNPCLLGGALTYTFNVTNAGPNTATSVAFTNILPAGVTLVSANVSQGAALTNATSVIASLGSLSSGTNAVVTVVVTPTSAAIPQGMTNATLTSTANVVADQTDLNLGNNTNSVVTAVNRPVADLAVAESVVPDPLVVGYILTNTVVVTNSGPATALNAVLTGALPPGAGFVSASSTVGTCTNTSSAVVCALGDLGSNATATVTIMLTNSLPGLMTNRVVLTTDSSDPNPANNSATYVTTVASPAPKIINAGTVLTYESGPANGAVDPGETVAMSLVLANVGSLDTVNLKATLLASGGVTLPSSPQHYGTLIQGGPSAARSYSFKAASSPGGAVVASLQLQDERPGVTNSLGTLVFTFNQPATSSWSYASSITIPDHGAAAPYPSPINVSGLTGRVSKATVTLKGLTHNFPHDVNVLLVSPGGSNVLAMSHTGGGHPVTNLTLTFDDAAAGSLPNYNALSSGTYKPSSYEGPVALPGTAQSKYYQTALSGVNWGAPNGAWSLYVFDDMVGDAGMIINGWSLNLTTVLTVGPVVDLAVGLSSAPGSLSIGGYLTNTITVTNLGPDTATGVVLTNPLPAGVTFISASLSQGSFNGPSGGLLTCNLGNLPLGSGAKVTIVTAPSQTGVLVNAVGAYANEEDIDLASSSAQTTTTVSASTSAKLTGFLSNGQFHLIVTAQPEVSYAILGSTNLTSWVSLSTNTASAGGVITFIDTNSPSLKQRFYRTKRLSP